MPIICGAPRVSTSLRARCLNFTDLNQTSIRDKNIPITSTRLRSLALEKSEIMPSSKAPSAIALQEAVRRGRDHLLGFPPPIRPATTTAPLPSCLAVPNLDVEELEFFSEDPENPASLPSQCWVPLRIVRKQQRQETSNPSSAHSARLPCVLLVHCTGCNKDSLALRQAQYARRGYITATIDTRYHGDRVDPNMPYQQALVKAWLEANAANKAAAENGGGSSSDGSKSKNSIERPFLLDVVWDLQRLIDYLVISRDDVDSERIGATGESLGGMVTWLLAAADPRITAVAPMCGVQNFRYAIENDLYHARVESIPHVFIQASKDLGRKGVVDREVVAAVWKIVPGLLTDPPENSYDAPYSLSLIAPRPCLILNGELDEKTAKKGVEIAVEHAKKAYRRELKAAGINEEESEERLKLFVEPNVGHEFTEVMHHQADLFMDKWLLNKKAA
jgi:dienelactone hydrolase